MGRRRLSLASRSAILRTACVLALALGCAQIDHGYKAQQYAGVPLEPSKGRGAERFAAELQMDETLASYVAEHGRPDFFYIVDRQKLYVFYTGTDKAAMFERVLTEPSQVTELGRIPGSLLKLLPEQTRAQVEARRASGQRQAQTKARRAHARIARNVPASGRRPILIVRPATRCAKLVFPERSATARSARLVIESVTACAFAAKIASFTRPIASRAEPGRSARDAGTDTVNATRSGLTSYFVRPTRAV